MAIEFPQFEKTWPEAFETLSSDEKRKVVGIAEVGVLEGWTHYIWHYVTREIVAP